ncbi:indolepyruvate ferredoxin oxidoreductase family protein [Bradyrhizobium ganzhouense]|uniref:indolepyruvate ferredoxin oxidoreductase family protein n=1 Tax=Bradyrhizobium ganzhouense TaxID=1179767 RepID=UPI003CEECE33
MNALVARENVTLDDKFNVQDGWIYLTGTQALTRLPIQQAIRDKAAGLNTGGFISGYRGSPLGRYDMELWAQKELLERHNIYFMPGINEELAATAVWGAQYVGQIPGAKVDGVFSIWYGKGPGTDRSADAFRHLGVAGANSKGGVLAIAGDDHGVKSSTVYNFSDPIFIATGMPVLYPSNTQELLELGLHGIALSRFSGCAVGFKVHNDVVEGGGSVYVDPEAPVIVLPDLAAAPELGPEGRNLRVFDRPLGGEERLVNHRLPAAIAYARANRLNYMVSEVRDARLGILSAGKSFQDVMQSLAGLELNEDGQKEFGIRVGKVGMIWPLDPEFIREFAAGLDVILVVEEKRGILEDQLKAILYDLALPNQPRVIGKYANAQAFAPERGEVVLQGWGELSSASIRHAISTQLGKLRPSLSNVLPKLPATKRGGGADPGAPNRNPGFCSGCPHNRSTKVPEGSRAIAGIGCHGMAAYNDPTKTLPIFAQMGAEGVHWLGQHRFTNEKHIFANIGDGTYFHSGFLAIRQSIAAKANITYKVLVNGFVSMTGGQPIEGDLSVHQIVTELKAEGAKALFVLTDDLEKYESASLPAEVSLLSRDDLDEVMLRCREIEGVTVIVYDQPCATERRRLRKRGKWSDPAKRSFINAAVCEGCGDCSTVSNCMSIEPLETEFGRKRKINQSSCNKDFSCVEGFCPSFVTVYGGSLRKAKKNGVVGIDFPVLPMPKRPQLTRDYSILLTGVGGTGVVTVGQILGLAAHVEGLAVSVLDVTGLAQKYGAVMSHVRFAPTADQLHATRIADSEADAVVGCDLVVTAGEEALARMKPRQSRVVVATDLVPTTDFSRNPDWRMDRTALIGRIQDRCGRESVLAIEGLRLATGLMGDPLANNMFMLGVAWQLGYVPLSLDSIMRAIELNNVQVDFNKTSFLWGRHATVNIAAVEKAVTKNSAQPIPERIDTSRDAIVARSMTYLTNYQDASYARRYKAFVDCAIAAEKARGLDDRFSTAIARYYFKLLAIKDEFEVARLFSSDVFKKELQETFEGNYTIRFNVGAWPFGGIDGSGHPYKKEIGPWLMRAFGLLKNLKRLRGTVFDPFRNNAERRLALRVLAEYEAEIGELIATVDKKTVDKAIALASLPEKIRGYGHVRERHVTQVEKERAAIRAVEPITA